MPISTCSCINKQQDELHGPNRRVFNRFTKNNGGLRCTVCGKEKESDKKPEDKKKKK